jgi:hypothetical protein
MNDDEKRAVELFCEKLFLRLGTIGLVRDELAAMNNQSWKAAGLELRDKVLGQCTGYAQNYVKKGLQERGVQLLRDLGSELVDVASDKQASAGYRALDAVARVIGCSFRNEVCVAVCIDPRYHNKLLVASNNRGLESAEIAEFLERQLNQPAQEALGEQDRNPDRLSGLSRDRGTLSKDDRDDYTQLRNQRDQRKLQTALSNLLTSFRSAVKVVKSEEDNVHAELQLLDYIEREIYHVGGAGKTNPLYLGVSLRCCAKCDSVFSAYNACGFNHVQVLFRGQHPTADVGGWRCPRFHRQAGEVHQPSIRGHRRGNPTREKARSTRAADDFRPIRFRG